MTDDNGAIQGPTHRGGPGLTGAAALRPTAKSAPRLSRLHNRSLVLGALFHGGDQSRADLARTTGLTRVTISDLVNLLIDQGYVAEGDPKAGRRVGKPANSLRLVPESANIVAMDLSDRATAIGAVFDLLGRPVVRRTTPMRDAQGDKALKTVLELAKSLVQASPRPVTGIGVASPGVVARGDVVVTAANYRWADLPLGDILSEEFGLPAYVGNDANLAARAEFTHGGASGSGLMVITVGRGLGAGILLNDVLLQGADNAAGEIGHVTAVEDGLPCKCGRNGCLETVLSLRGLADIKNPDDPDAYNQVGAIAARVLAPVVSAFNLSELVFACSAGPLPQGLLDAIDRETRRRVLPANWANLTVRQTSLGRDIALLGASALVLGEEIGIT